MKEVNPERKTICRPGKFSFPLARLTGTKHTFSKKTYQDLNSLPAYIFTKQFAFKIKRLIFAVLF
jgi:hypothetical protein